MPSTNAENVGDGQGRGVRVVFAERGFVASELFEGEAAGVHVELSFRAALQMLRGYDADVSGQHLFVQVMHRKRRARENKEYAASIVFAESGLAPHRALLAPLIGTRTLDEPQILYGGFVILEDGLNRDLRRVEVVDMEGGQVGIVRIERGDGPI